MDTLIAIGVLSTYSYSVYGKCCGKPPCIFRHPPRCSSHLFLLGRFIEFRAKEKISGAITTLFPCGKRESPNRAGRQGNLDAADKVSTGDLFLVFPGERMPVDGRIFSGQAVLDESIITGESAL